MFRLVLLEAEAVWSVPTKVKALSCEPERLKLPLSCPAFN